MTNLTSARKSVREQLTNLVAGILFPVTPMLGAFMVSNVTSWKSLLIPSEMSQAPSIIGILIILVVLGKVIKADVMYWGGVLLLIGMATYGLAHWLQIFGGLYGFFELIVWPGIPGLALYKFLYNPSPKKAPTQEPAPQS